MNDAGRYGLHLSDVLMPRRTRGEVVLDLFAGCGGLALGFEAAGFETVGYEMNEVAAETYSANLIGDCIPAHLTPDFDFPDADVVIGGPPCQPFSVGGLQAGAADVRNGFPAFVAAVRCARPRFWMFENVKGMLYRNREYFDCVVSELGALGYVVSWRVLNAADFGVPQKRERVIVVGHLGEWRWPAARTRVVTAGEALEGLPDPSPGDIRLLTPAQDAYIARYEAKSKCVRPRDLRFDEPARTLTCRNLGGATSDMHRIRLANGSRRRLLVREAARLQSFPDWFEFPQSETAAFNLIGNAVAPLFALSVAHSVAAHLDGAHADAPLETLF